VPTGRRFDNAAQTIAGRHGLDGTAAFRCDARPNALPDHTHPRLAQLIERARRRSAREGAPALGVVYPCDRLALEAAVRIADAGIARPVLIGPAERIRRAGDAAGFDLQRFELVPSDTEPRAVARHAAELARDGVLAALMKGALHTDELMSAVVNRHSGLRGASRISHAFVFDLPRYPKLLALADCVVNIAPNLRTKHDIIGNALWLLERLGVAQPKVAIVTAIESVNPAIPATLDARSLVEAARKGAWPGAIVDGPFGFDNAVSAEAARIKHLDSTVCGDADLLLVPDLNAGNMLYKSFTYIGGGLCGGLVLGARVPIALTSRADPVPSRVASAALAVLALPSQADAGSARGDDRLPRAPSVA
jgi:phosphate acetyltransferase/phosphate butyryltransferase